MKNYLEDINYQFRPFFYLTGAIYCFKNCGQSNLMFGGAALLSFTAIVILKMRYDYRYGALRGQSY